MKELFDDLKIVTSDTVLQLPTKSTILTESSPTIEVEDMDPGRPFENSSLAELFKTWSEYLDKSGIGESDKHFANMYIHYPSVYKHRKFVKRPGSGQRRATVFCIKSKTRILKNVTPLGVKAVEWIDAPKLENVTLELRFEGEEVKNGSVQAE